MATQSITLRQVLTQAKPRPHCTWGKSRQRNTLNEIWPDLNTNPTAIWDEFNLENLNESYGHILDLSYPDQLSPRADEILPYITLATSSDIHDLISWNNKLMAATVPFAMSQLGLHPGVFLCQKSAVADSYVSLPDAPASQAGHIIYLDDIPKLAYNCNISKTRYGYIQTDEELVVCCFSQTAEKWRVKFMPISWTTHGFGALTTDLALWWLCMLAMSSSEHRAIVSEDEMVKINEWDVICLETDQNWVRRHRYSKLEEHITPATTQSYTTSLLGPTVSLGAGKSIQDTERSDIEDAKILLNFAIKSGANVVSKQPDV
ncbi:hypothetical protein E4U42_006302 [Claviceps africana]|uniref:Uncharacterized protein n=1 Tax=Claviceps africana TaxID=83212 RepID=A0A8K0JB78_9HYPO|nr:hypothetical protein E4U42_006302 [Claviceps africana]